MRLSTGFIWFRIGASEIDLKKYVDVRLWTGFFWFRISGLG
jgi:hypothetical protein